MEHVNEMIDALIRAQKGNNQPVFVQIENSRIPIKSVERDSDSNAVITLDWSRAQSSET